MTTPNTPDRRGLFRRLGDVTVWPRRDWRFWTALAVFGAVLCVGTAMKSQIGTNDVLHRDNKILHDDNDRLVADNGRLVTQVDEQGDVNQCRSRAAVFADQVASQADALVALGLSAVGRGQSTAPFADALDAARRNTARALTARDDAVQTCESDPNYTIPDSILEPIPTYPLPAKG